MHISVINGLASMVSAARERREARAHYKALQQELSTFRTEREVEDLLGTVEDQDGREAEQIRNILLDNLRPAIGLGRIV
jgi:hypothetical protein